MDTLESMIADAYTWAERKKAGLSVNGQKFGVREAKREAIRQALLIPGISQRGVAQLTGASSATVTRVIQDMKLARSAAA